MNPLFETNAEVTPDILFVDCRHSLNDTDAGQQLYEERHLPNAIFAHVEKDMSDPEKIAKKLYQAYKKAFWIVWIMKHSQKGNKHMPAQSATIKKIPFSREKVWIRPTMSDVSRVEEFMNKIYFEDCYLHSALKAKNIRF